MSSDLRPPPSQPGNSPAEERWDNEGGHITDAVRRSALPRSRMSPECRALTDQVRTMSLRLSDDFVNARLGKRLNLYQHRSRVLRQLKERLRIASLIPAPARIPSRAGRSSH